MASVQHQQILTANMTPSVKRLKPNKRQQKANSRIRARGANKIQTESYYCAEVFD